MQILLKELPDFESKIKGDPLELLKQVKVLMHTPIRARYPFLTLTKNIASLLNTRQGEGETLLEYLDRFKQVKNVVRDQLGKHVLDRFIELYPHYREETAAQQTIMKDTAFDAWMAAIFLRGSDQSIYGELVKDYRKDYTNQDAVYPKSIRDVIDVMRQLAPKKKRRDNKYNNRNRRGNDTSKDKEKMREKPASYRKVSAGAAESLDAIAEVSQKGMMFPGKNGTIGVRQHIIKQVPIEKTPKVKRVKQKHRVQTSGMVARANMSSSKRWKQKKKEVRRNCTR